jgi:hypothetical protein
MVMLEWQRDWAHKGTNDAVMDIVKTHCSAYGMGVEYAYTMLHGAPATKLAFFGHRLSVDGRHEQAPGPSACHLPV